MATAARYPGVPVQRHLRQFLDASMYVLLVLTIFFVLGVSSFSRNKSADEIIINEGDMHLKICEGLRKEFQEMRRLWTYYGDLIAAQDELSMCKERLRLRLGNELVPKPKSKKNALLKNLENTFESDIQHINIIDIVNVSILVVFVKKYPSNLSTSKIPLSPYMAIALSTLRSMR